MRSTLLIAVAASVLPAFAQDSTSQTDSTLQSGNFNLVIKSSNNTINNQVLGSCHNGAAHQELCLFDFAFNATDNFVNFQLNFTQSVCTETNSTGTFTVPCTNAPPHPEQGPGTLTWFEQFEGQDGLDEVSQAMGLGYLPWTNVAIAQVTFEGEDAFTTRVSFDDDSLLFMSQPQDDTVEPANEFLAVPRPLYQWFVCNTFYVGYTYQALTWKLGVAPPQNPTCQAVNVTRVFT